MSVTIDSLDIQIRSSAGSAKQNIEGLAKALEQLNGQAKVTKIVNALDKLNVSLTNLRSNAGVMGQLSSLSKSLSQLASIPKLTGLQSAITQLQKLPGVLNGLSATTMLQLEQKIRQLSNALTPLATKLGAIGTAFGKLPPKISQVVTATNRMNSAVRENSSALNHQSFNLMTAIYNLQAYLSAIHFVGDAVSRVMADAIEWDGIQFRFGRAFGEDAEEVYAYAQKVSEVLKINIQQFMQYSSLYGSLLKGFGMAQEKVTTISVGLTELSYDIWAAYNDRFKTLEDASEAIRSAITGEIEPIRNAGIALTEASLQEYIDSTHLAGISIEKLTEAQKAEVRYAAMVDAALNQGIIGTYAREMQTAEGAVRTLSQQLKTLGQALGSLFIPALQIAVPWLSAFVELLTEGLIALGAMFGIKFQEISWDKSASGLGNMAENAGATGDALSDATKEAKKLKSYTMGFDELNVINPTSASGSGSGSGEDNGWGSGLDLETLWDDAVFASASKQIDEIKEKISAWKIPILAALGLLGTAGMISVMGTIISKIVEATNLIRAFTAALGGSQAAMSALSFISTKWANVASVLVGIPTFISNIWAQVVGLVGGFKAALTVSGSFVGGLTAGPILLVAGIIAAIASVVVFLKQNWEEVTNAAKGFFETNIVPKLESIKKSWDELKEALAPVWNVLVKVGGALLDMLPGFNLLKNLFENYSFSEIISDIGKAFELLGGVLFSLASSVVAGAFSAIVGFAAGVVEAFTGVIQVISGVVQFFEALFTGGDLSKPIQMIADGIVNIFTGLYKSTIGVVVDFVKGIIDWFVELWDELVGHSIVPDMIEAIIEWFKKLPDKIISVVKDFCSDVKQFFVDLWDGIKSWWNTNVAPKFTLSYWKEKFDVIREAISSKLSEVKQTASNKWDEVKTWFASNVASKFTLDYWKNKFDVIRSAVATKLAEVKEAASMQWDKIKTWFTSNIAPKFTLSFWLDKFKNLKEGFTQTIKNAVNAGIDLLNRFINWINDNLNFSWDPVVIAGKEILPGGSVQLFTIPNIPRFEKGGFIEDGLFTMNHGEIAGKFSNGKSVVANNQQIVDGIAAGVYEAVVAAMNASNGRQDQNINVYLDGKQIYASVKKHDSERGRQLIGNQLGYSY